MAGELTGLPLPTSHTRRQHEQELLCHGWLAAGGLNRLERSERDRLQEIKGPSQLGGKRAHALSGLALVYASYSCASTSYPCG